MDIPGQPAPSLHRHPRAAASQLLQAGPPASTLNRYSMPPVSAVGALPLAARRTDPPAGRPLPALAFSRSVQSRRPGSRHLHAGHHLASTAGSRQASSREAPVLPVSMSSRNFDASTTTPGPQPAKPDTSGTPSWSPPDRVKPSLLPDRSPRRSSANAAPGGLTPTPAGPTPEGQQPPSLAQHRL